MKRLLLCLLLVGCNEDIETNYVPADYIINHGESLTVEFYEDATEINIRGTDLTYYDNDGFYSITIPGEYLAAKCGYDHTSRLLEYYPKIDGIYQNRKPIGTQQTILDSSLFLIEGYWFVRDSGLFNPITEYTGSLTPNYTLFNTYLTIDSNGNIDVPAIQATYRTLIKTQEGFSCSFVIQATRD